MVCIESGVKNDRINSPLSSENPTETTQQAYNQAIEIYKLGNVIDAKHLFENLIGTAPEFVPAYIELAQIEFNEKKYLKAFALLCYAYNYSYSDSVTFPLAKVFYELRPYLMTEMSNLITKIIKDIPHFRRHLSSALFEFSCLEESLEQIEILEKSGDNSILPIIGKAICLQKMGEPKQAIELYKKALKIEPRLNNMKWNIALCEMQIMGNITQRNLEYYEEGLALDTRPPIRKFAIPMWHGENIKNKKLLIYPEQGIGDEIRFTAHLTQIAPLAQSCKLECAKKLEPLFQRSFPNIEVNGIINAEFMQEHDLKRADADYRIPMGSMRYHAFKLLGKYETPKKFLYADDAKTAFWKEKIDRATLPESKLKVAICWRSQNMNARRIKSYVQLEDWIDLLKIPNITFFNANYAQGSAEELHKLNQENKINIINFPELDQKDDLDSTAAYLSNMDLVISVGTAVCELAGGLGIKTWRIDNFSPSKTCELKKHGFDLASVMRIEKHYSQDWSELFTSLQKTLIQYINDN